MFIIIVLSALTLWAVIATIVELRRDGFRRTPTDWNRVAESERTARGESRPAHLGPRAP